MWALYCRGAETKRTTDSEEEVLGRGEEGQREREREKKEILVGLSL